MDRKLEYQKLLTVPEKLTDYEELWLTGNEYLSLPRINRGGGIDSLNLLRLDCHGLLEFRGSGEASLLKPTLKVNGKNIDLAADAGWRYEEDWVPAFRAAESEGCLLEGEIFAPPGQKGFCYRLRLTNTGSDALDIELGWEGEWDSFNYLVFKRRALEARQDIFYDRWTRSLVLEGMAGLPLAALALAVESDEEWQINEEQKCYSICEQFNLASWNSREIVLYAAVNLEGDGAGTTNIDLRRRGSDRLKEETVNWLSSRRCADADELLATRLNRNLFFSYFYAAGRCLVSEKLVPVTSRSPRYYVSAAFWSRDSLLWSFPAMLIADQERARELLLTAYERHIRNAGDHAHYINGALLYPGFELDQLAAYVIALAHYVKSSEDYTILSDQLIQRGLTAVAGKALDQFDPEVGLYTTFLDPSDDPAIYPYLTFDNALLQRAFTFLGEMQSEERWNHKSDFSVLANELTRSIYEHCTVKGPFGPMFAWSVDGKGKFYLYDNPPGSLQLLAHYGFCDARETVYRNTVCWIRSNNNRFFRHGDNFEEAASIHANNPWPLGACNDLLAFNAGAVDFFRRAEMDNGFFCESVDPASGLVSTGAAFASAAGFFAYALKNRNRQEDLCHEVADDILPVTDDHETAAEEGEQ